MGSSTSIQPHSNLALKEWAAVVEAIGQGEQAILLRKYAPARREFFLYPTCEFVRRKDYLFHSSTMILAFKDYGAHRDKLLTQLLVRSAIAGGESISNPQ